MAESENAASENTQSESAGREFERIPTPTPSEAAARAERRGRPGVVIPLPDLRGASYSTLRDGTSNYTRNDLARSTIEYSHRLITVEEDAERERVVGRRAQQATQDALGQERAANADLRSNLSKEASGASTARAALSRHEVEMSDLQRQHLNVTNDAASLREVIITNTSRIVDLKHELGQRDTQITDLE